MFFNKMLTVFASILIVVAGYLWFTRTPAQFPVEPTEQNDLLLKQLAATFNGEIVYDSNRSGRFGIYRQSIGSKEPIAVVDSQLHEMYPDPSPDGRYIVFARTDSLAREAPGEVWIINSDGSGERKLASNGTFPTFSRDGSTVYFERDRRKVIAIQIDGSNEREIFPAQHTDWVRYHAIKPRISADNTTVFFTSDRGGRWNAYYVELATGKFGHVGRGCEPAPFTTDHRAVWVTKSNVLSKSGIGMFDRQSDTRETLHDLGPPYGHEYFPSLAPGDQHLLYAACPGSQHDHLSANYQVFVRDLQSNTTVRITHDTHTNRWPKVLPTPSAE